MHATFDSQTCLNVVNNSMNTVLLLLLVIFCYIRCILSIQIMPSIFIFDFFNDSFENSNEVIGTRLSNVCTRNRKNFIVNNGRI